MVHVNLVQIGSDTSQKSIIGKKLYNLNEFTFDFYYI